MLPLSLLNASKGRPMQVELKNGETYNGHLVNCDPWMNISLQKVILTSPDGETFFSLEECYIRGSSIKYLRIQDDVIDNVKEESQRNKNQMRNRSNMRGRGRGRNSNRGRGGNNNIRS
ncbi:like-Sm domain-containing protein [Neocallimastix lanati (nom. inval.)]|jgi:U6 snRNA-associated Sm-like protein LSm4|uniref:LSM complex subunit LSM4 n=1 Tax=Neocallimastix californiae TaxID=1754190 RepID=A0A1Y2BYJ0_9FUNG|nr:like-Sm domain-containing protein [Neocallimastix sp. JGI-2020a]ORY39796.1 Sm-like ribonucleo protein [Neocallimastix californiae]|eukprot:ORY39796.1 Sm-like ribonucleo protein [Neocallimastix californiae]